MTSNCPDLLLLLILNKDTHGGVSGFDGEPTVDNHKTISWPELQILNGDYLPTAKNKTEDISMRSDSANLNSRLGFQESSERTVMRA